jgi:uncharacterized membrane protein
MTSWATRFRIRQYLKGSLWFLPLLGGVAGTGLATLDSVVEDRLEVSIWSYSSGTATGLLTAIIGAMVGLLGFVVTIGVLVVQTATGTLSPRFMRIWYRDRLQKIVLAVFVGTLTFSFALLRRITSDDVPNLGVTVAGALVVVSIILLLLYLDRFTHALRPVAVGTLVARAGLRVIASAPRSSPDARLPAPLNGPPTLAVRSIGSGVVQAVNVASLVATARRGNLLIRLTRSPGDFVPAGAVIMEVFGAGSPPPERKLAGTVALGHERTIDQDPAFALRILVDIAIRALSPAVNDPTTAVQMIDQIEVFLQGVAQGPPRTGVVVLADGGGIARLIVPARRFETYLELALVEILRYGRNNPQVCRRLAAMLAELAPIVRPANRRAVDAAAGALAAAVMDSYPDPAARSFAGVADHQGIGGPTEPDPHLAGGVRYSGPTGRT